MKFLKKTLAPAGLALCAMAAATPAAAQVDGRIATSSVSRAVVNTNALQAAFPQIQQTYSAQLQTLQTKQTAVSYTHLTLPTKA